MEAWHRQSASDRQAVSLSCHLEVRQERVARKNSSPLRLVWRNRSLRSIALMVISYGMCSSLLEVTWKGKVKAAYEATEYSRFMGQCWTLTGAASIAMLLCGRTVLERFGYAFGVMFTPIVMAIAGCVFFLADDMAAYYGDDMSHSAAKVAAYAGGLAVVLSKAAKYSFFDATKEMAFIPLGAREKAIGKASIDVVAYRLAKSGGSFVLEFAVFAFGTLGSARASLFLTLVFILSLLRGYTRAQRQPRRCERLLVRTRVCARFRSGAKMPFDVRCNIYLV